MLNARCEYCELAVAFLTAVLPPPPRKPRTGHTRWVVEAEDEGEEDEDEEEDSEESEESESEEESEESEEERGGKERKGAEDTASISSGNSKSGISSSSGSGGDSSGGSGGDSGSGSGNSGGSSGGSNWAREANWARELLDRALQVSTERWHATTGTGTATTGATGKSRKRRVPKLSSADALVAAFIRPSFAGGSKNLDDVVCKPMEWYAEHFLKHAR